MPITTFNAYHLGDNLVHLHFLRRLAAAHPEQHFIHGAAVELLPQLHPLTVDLPNLTLTDLGSTIGGAINAWRGVGGHWYSHPQRGDFVGYHLHWFRHLAAQMGYTSPFHCAADFLFDYPALKLEPFIGLGDSPLAQDWDILLVNSAPLSGQWSAYSPAGFDALCRDLLARGHRVITTRPTATPAACTSRHDLSITGIGRLSQRCRAIVGCVTGPLWPTLNTFNRHTVELRVHLLDHERVDYLPATTVHANHLSLAREILTTHGYL